MLDPVEVYCPICEENVYVRRYWKAEICADVLFDSGVGKFCADMEYANLPELDYPQDGGGFFCPECGEVLARDERELTSLIEQQKE